MHRLFIPLILLSLACAGIIPATPTATSLPTATFTPVPSATFTPRPTVTRPPPPTATPTPQGYLPTVIFHPDPQLYAGDLVSLEVIGEDAPATWRDAEVALFLDEISAAESSTEPLAQANFGQFGIGGRAQATFMWVWDTTGLSGTQTLVARIQPPRPENADFRYPPTILTFTVDLLPADQRPMPEPLAEWAKAESECCVFYYLTHTAAARDIEEIKATADSAFDQVESVLGVTQTEKIRFELLSRLLGHGGFASDAISLTYIDRNAVGSQARSIFIHEGTHILDRQIARNKPTMLVEGLAVYVSGGHYKPEDLEARAAGLLHLEGQYIPLADLTNAFYPAQHEIGYLQAGAFVHYLVQRFGWERFRAFYASFQDAPSEAAMLDAALRLNFDLTLEEMEAEWLAHLRTLPFNQDYVDDVRLTVALYDTLRRYQQLHDPSAYFLNAWLVNGQEARMQGITADVVRHPTAPFNIAYEAMLNAASQGLVNRDYAQTDALLVDLNLALDAADPNAAPLAATYLTLVNQIAALGYETQTLAIVGDTATATVIREWPTLETLVFVREGESWRLENGD